MAKVARAARVASKQRAEVLGSGTDAPTDKVIGAAETGELYMINHNNASALTITLPPIASGAYFRFQLMAELSANGSIVIQKNSATSAGLVKGTVLSVLYAGSSADTTIATNKDAGSATKFTISDDAHVGTYVDVFCDGTNWQFSGVCISSALNLCVFDA
jgi:hypothetical protein